MSGGSMEYLYSRVRDVADNLGGTPRRVAFAKHLHLVADALHDIEWVDSCDYGAGDEDAAIMKCISNADVLAASFENARKALRELKDIIEEMS